MDRQHSHRNRKSRKKEYSLIREYRFEITVISLFALGVFLIIEKMNIKIEIYHIILNIITSVQTYVLLVFHALLQIAGEIETSDIVGLILILIALGMVFRRMRYRIFKKYAFLSACPKCEGDLKRIHRTYIQKLAEIILFAKLKHYSCKKCAYHGFTIGYRSKS